MLCFCTRVAWVCFVGLLLCKEEGSSPSIFWQLLRGGIWACMRLPCLCLLLCLDGDYVSQPSHMCGNMLGVKSSFQHAREKCEPKGRCVLGV